MESPFSWNVRYLSKSGFPCQLTVRAEQSTVLIEKIGGVEKWLVESGATPAGPEAPATIVATPSTPEPERGPDWCSIHQVAMAKHEKDGKSWYSHQVDEGWCRGKPNGKK